MRHSPITRNYLAQNASSAKIEKPWNVEEASSPLGSFGNLHQFITSFFLGLARYCLSVNTFYPHSLQYT